MTASLITDGPPPGVVELESIDAAPVVHWPVKHYACTGTHWVATITPGREQDEAHRNTTTFRPLAYDGMPFALLPDAARALLAENAARWTVITAIGPDRRRWIGCRAGQTWALSPLTPFASPAPPPVELRSSMPMSDERACEVLTFLRERLGPPQGKRRLTVGVLGDVFAVTASMHGDNWTVETTARLGVGHDPPHLAEIDDTRLAELVNAINYHAVGGDDGLLSVVRIREFHTPPRDQTLLREYNALVVSGNASMTFVHGVG